MKRVLVLAVLAASFAACAAAGPRRPARTPEVGARLLACQEQEGPVEVAAGYDGVFVHSAEVLAAVASCGPDVSVDFARETVVRLQVGPGDYSSSSVRWIAGRDSVLTIGVSVSHHCPGGYPMGRAPGSFYAVPGTEWSRLEFKSRDANARPRDCQPMP